MSRTVHTIYIYAYVPTCISATPVVVPTGIPALSPARWNACSLNCDSSQGSPIDAGCQFHHTNPQLNQLQYCQRTVAGPATTTPAIVTLMVLTSASILPTTIRSLMPTIVPTTIVTGMMVPPLVATASMMPTV